MTLRWAKLHNGPGSSTRLDQSLVYQLKRGCYSHFCLRAKDHSSFPSRLTGKRTVSQTIDNQHPQNTGRFDDFPCIPANFFSLNRDADAAGFKGGCARARLSRG
jgi:hypothetical protein